MLRVFGRREALWVGLLVGGLTTVSLSVATIPTTIQNFFLAGTQPNMLLEPIADAQECMACHAYFDAEKEPGRLWAASMMGQSARDPIFHAALAIANQDAAFAGELCIRCHVPGGWLEGRSKDPTGGMLNATDMQGVSCNFCHRMVDPVFTPGSSPPVDHKILAQINPKPESPHSGNFIVDPVDRRRGPLDLGPEFTWHTWLKSPFHSKSAMCATCHDVSNPVFVRQPDGTYAMNTPGQPHPTGNKADMFPLERTFSEWSQSIFAQGPVDVGGRFGGNLPAVSSCQDCHMPHEQAKNCVMGDPRPSVPLHHFNGANTWVLKAIRNLYDDSETFLSAATVDASIARAREMLQKASDTELISFVNVMILARLLMPDDFGIVILAAIAIAVVEAVTATSYGAVLVRRLTVDRDFYDTVWTMNVLRGVIFGAIVVVTAELQADILGDPRIASILLVVALTIALDGFASVGLMRLEREMRFDRLTRFHVTSRIAVTVCTLTLAFALGNYWCLVLGNLAARVFTLPFTYWIAPHAPRFCLKHWRELLHFSKWMVVVNSCQMVEMQAANFALGRFVGTRALGMWGVSYQLAAVPVTELAVPIRQPIYAGYAQVQRDPALLRAHFLAGFGLLAAAIVPFSVGTALVAPQLERLVLGQAWQGAAVFIAICALYTLIECLAHFTGSIFYIKDAQDRLARVYVPLMAIRVACVVPAAIQFGAPGVGAAMIGTALLNCVVWHWRTALLMDIPRTATLMEARRPLFAAAAMSVVVIAIQSVWPTASGTLAVIWQLCVLAGVGAAVHIGTALLLWWQAGMPPGAERRLMVIAGTAWRSLRERLGRRRARPCASNRAMARCWPATAAGGRTCRRRWRCAG
ncbi:oligosaccharide flippase family protein [Leptolyngbya sp. 15MV]|nr:oligosaccharide flippase family protein [Leptolyngbya sp. 15MV]